MLGYTTSGKNQAAHYMSLVYRALSDDDDDGEILFQLCCKY